MPRRETQLDKFLTYLKEQEWKIAFSEKGENCLPQEIEKDTQKFLNHGGSLSAGLEA